MSAGDRLQSSKETRTSCPMLGFAATSTSRTSRRSRSIAARRCCITAFRCRRKVRSRDCSTRWLPATTRCAMHPSRCARCRTRCAEEQPLSPPNHAAGRGSTPCHRRRRRHAGGVIALVGTVDGTFAVDLETEEVEPEEPFTPAPSPALNLPRVVAAATAGSTIVAVVDAKPPVLVSHDAGTTWRESGRGPESVRRRRAVLWPTAWRRYRRSSGGRSRGPKTRPADGRF